jgi:hypothetical protein
MDLKIKYEKGFIKPDKNSLILLGIVLVLAILVGIGLFYYFKKPAPEIIIDDEIFKQLQRQEILGQLEELEISKEEIPPLSSKEIQKQLKELNNF